MSTATSAGVGTRQQFDTLGARTALAEMTGGVLPIQTDVVPNTPRAGEVIRTYLHPLKTANGKEVGLVGRERRAWVAVLPVEVTNPTGAMVPTWGLFQGLGDEIVKHPQKIVELHRAGLIQCLPLWERQVRPPREGMPTPRNPVGTTYFSGDAGGNFIQVNPLATPRQGTGEQGEPPTTHVFSMRVKPPDQIARDRERIAGRAARLQQNRPMPTQQQQFDAAKEIERIQSGVEKLGPEEEAKRRDIEAHARFIEEQARAQANLQAHTPPRNPQPVPPIPASQEVVPQAEEEPLPTELGPEDLENIPF